MDAIVRDVMTPDVITVGEDTSFEVIAAALREPPGQRVPRA